jgi:membrane-bound ClpP family serine protease
VGAIDRHHPSGSRTGSTHIHPNGAPMLVLGIILLLLDMFVLGTGILTTIGWILIIVGLILVVLGALNRSIGPRRYYY